MKEQRSQCGWSGEKGEERWNRVLPGQDLTSQVKTLDPLLFATGSHWKVVSRERYSQVLFGKA